MSENNIVKRVCKELGVTQKELAEKIGVHEGTVRKWSSGETTPDWAAKFLDLIIENEKNKEIVLKFKEVLNLLNK